MNSDLPKISKETMDKLLTDQQDEITAHHLYKKIANYVKDEHNAKIIREVSEDELEHYNRLKNITQKELKPQKMKIFFFYWITVLLGITFGIKLLERGEKQAIDNYEDIHQELKFIDGIIKDEERHEDELIGMINEERLNYIGSIVLGLNDWTMFCRCFWWTR